MDVDFEAVGGLVQIGVGREGFRWHAKKFQKKKI